MIRRHIESMRALRSVLVLSVLIVLASCSDGTTKQPTVDVSQLDMSVSNYLSGTEITFMDSTMTKAVVSAHRARVFAARQETVLDTAVVVKFYNANGELNATLSCDMVQVDNRSNNMIATGNVIVDAKRTQTKVETKTMTWDNARRKLYSSEYVRITKPGELIEGGIGFESDEAMSNYRIFKVSGVKQQ